MRLTSGCGISMNWGRCDLNVVGIDASSNNTGIALFQDGRYIAHRLIDEHANKNTYSRIINMMNDIIDTLEEYKPDHIIMEECILKTNVQTVKILSYIAGSVMGWAAMNDVGFQFTLPSQWRKLVGIKQNNQTTRKQLKEQAVEMVRHKYNLSVNDDVAESILIAESFFVY